VGPALRQQPDPRTTGKELLWAKKRVQTRPKPDKPTAERLADHLAGLPHEIAWARAYIADADYRLRHLADCLEPAIHEFYANDHPDRIPAAATQIWASVVVAVGVLLDLAVFIAKLEGLAWWDSRSGADDVGECGE
jgi:hypothetical protein